MREARSIITAVISIFVLLFSAAGMVSCGGGDITGGFTTTVAGPDNTSDNINSTADKPDDEDNGSDDGLEITNEKWVSEWAIQAGNESATDLMIAAGPGGTLHVVSGDYYSNERCDLRYAYFNGEAWVDEKVPSDSPFYGEEANIAVDSKNIPHIVYIDEAGLGIYHVTKDNGWQSELVTTPPGFSLCVGIDIDSYDNPHIVYDTCASGKDYKYAAAPDDEESGFWYAYKDGEDWEVEKITDDEVMGRSVAVDTLDVPHTAYTKEFEDGAIYYACRAGGVWVSEKIDNGWMQGSDVDIDTDSQNRPHLVYKDANMNLKYAVKDANEWKIMTLVEDSGEQEGVRIEIDNRDTVHIYYSFEDEFDDDGNIVSCHIYLENGVWQNEAVGNGGEGDISVGDDGIIHICSGMCPPDEDNVEWVRAFHRVGKD